MPYAAVNGLNMYYEVHGDGPPLLLLHGGTASIPEGVIPFFADWFQVIAIEQMGHGRTADNAGRAHASVGDQAWRTRRLQRRRHHRSRHGDPPSRARDEARSHRREQPHQWLRRRILTGSPCSTPMPSRCLTSPPASLQTVQSTGPLFSDG